MDGTPPEQAFYLRPGEYLGGRYVVGTVLGAGGFGVTYKAWDTVLGAVVAIKEFYPGGLVSRMPGQRAVVVFTGEKADSYRTQLTRFLDEARNMAKFAGEPNVIGVYNFFEENNTAYIVMEYLDGQTLKEYMAEKGGKLPEEEALHYIRPILEAVASIHSKKIIHRDLSPDNIFILRDGRVKVLDFGAARFSENPSGVTQTVVVKPGYAPPEQYRSKIKQGPWTDLYAAGATLYKMLTGLTPMESIDRMEKDAFRPPSASVELHDDTLDVIVLKSMALQPEVRFRSARDFLDALDGSAYLFLSQGASASGAGGGSGGAGGSESRYDALFPNRLQMPIAFAAPACYANTTLASPDDAPPLTELIATMLDPDAAAAFSVSAMGGGDPVRTFLNDGLPYLASTTRRLREVQENLPGYYAVFMPAGSAGISVTFDGCLWGVNAAADSNKQLAAQMFLGYLLGDYAQNVLCLQNGVGIPINRNVYGQYMDINPDLAYVRGLVEG
uniref:Putative serine/threonine protein kinase n=1 Tax=uncultured bacterium contig00040 TaxID=1181528 RepID=A0A806KQJ5_9BACT|nr:putative serine/threonine protein kinase [uncultured bacterium contig00040]